MVGAVAYALLAVPLAFLVLTKRFFSPLPIVIALQVAGMLVVVWARLTFGMRSFHVGSTATQGGLVTTGPYRFVRHPIYAGVLVILAGVLVGHHYIATLIPVACVALALVVRIVAEERAILRTYPEYASYAQRTKRIIPRVL
jgi:protein-S-isoprenylcysteine O-methyltransferase Ste14